MSRLRFEVKFWKMYVVSAQIVNKNMFVNVDRTKRAPHKDICFSHVSKTYFDYTKTCIGHIRIYIENVIYVYLTK